MKAFYGTRISDRLSETPEGFLVCHSVRVARTGEQKYRGSEFGLDTEEMIRVWRSPEAVFEPAAMASLEGKPITSPHPPTFLTPENATAYQRGHVQNVRRGDRLATGEETLIADLVITDAELIEKVSNGLRECSVGYHCEWVPQGDGSFEQQKIRANHLAIVPDGRAGDEMRIMDMDIADARAREAEHFEQAARRYHRTGYHVRSDQDVIAETAPRRVRAADARQGEAEDFEDSVKALRAKLLGR